MATSNLSIISASLNSAGQLVCIVNPTADLWIKELIIVPYGVLPIPIGVVKPGTQETPVIRTIYVDSQDPVFNTPAPFTLALTYDSNFKLTAPIAVVALGLIQAALANLDLRPVAGLTSDQAAIFVTEAVKAAAQQFNPLQPGARIVEPDAAPQAHQGKGHSSTGQKNGKEQQQHPKY